MTEGIALIAFCVVYALVMNRACKKDKERRDAFMNAPWNGRDVC